MSCLRDAILTALGKRSNKPSGLRPILRQASTALVRHFTAKRDLAGAIDAFRAALDINAAYGEAADNLSVVLRELGDLAEAKQWSLRAIELEPHNGRFLRHLADHEPVRADNPVVAQLERAAAAAEGMPHDLRIDTLFG
jgi:tetratricopeptide (TPR) repeat protein